MGEPSSREQRYRLAERARAEAAKRQAESTDSERARRRAAEERRLAYRIEAHAGLRETPLGQEPRLQPTPAERFAAESEKIDGLVTGSAAVSAPATAKTGHQFTVYLRVSPDKLDELLKGLKDEFPENETLRGKAGIKLSPRMSASVSGFGFSVFPPEAQAQAVSATEVTTWQWQVKPLESGQLTLTFTLAGALSVEGKDVTRNFYQYRQKVEVAVSPLSFMQQYWQWLASSLVLPAGAALWAALRKPKDAAGKRQPSVVERLRERRAQKARA